MRNVEEDTDASRLESVRQIGREKYAQEGVDSLCLVSVEHIFLFTLESCNLCYLCSLFSPIFCLQSVVSMPST